MHFYKSLHKYVALAKKLALTCRSEREDREAEAEVEKLEQEIENDDSMEPEGLYNDSCRIS